MTKKIATVIQAMLLALFMQGCSADDSGRNKEAEKSSEAGTLDFSKDSKSKDEYMSEWIGAYDPISDDCDLLSIQESKFTWGNCKEVGMNLVSITDAELTVQVDPSAQCGWAGKIVSFGVYVDKFGTEHLSPQLRISVQVYETMDDYKNKNRIVYCAYKKTERN